MKHVVPIILALMLRAAPAAMAACLEGCPDGADGTFANATSAHCGGNMPATPCHPGGPTDTSRERHDVTCGCMTCRQGQEDAEHALITLADRTLHSVTAPCAVPGLLDTAAEAPAVRPDFGDGILPQPDLPFISSVVLLI